MSPSTYLTFGLLGLLSVLLPETLAKCSLTPLEGDRRSWIAYACVQGDFSDLQLVPSNAEWIEFTVSRIHRLPPDAFARFPNLRRLTFYNCDLRDISEQAFRGLNNLEWLVMSNTPIGLARARLFRHLGSLKRLTLDSAGLVYVEPEVFHNIRNLESLSLRDNDLDCLPIHAMAALTNLRTVQIGKNPWLCDCRTSLAKFFADRRIAQGPDESCIVGNVTGRDGCGRQVYDCMTALEYPKLPAPEATFKQIESHHHGRFEWRDKAATGLATLDCLQDETSWIQMTDVEVPIIPRYSFFRFGNTLRSIEIVNCGVREIEREAFAGLHKLERLILVGNGLFTICHDTFRDLGTLRELILRRNNIKKFEANALVHLRSLKRLDISENRLSCLHEDCLKGLVALERFEGTGNPWICGCKADLENYFTRMTIGFDINSGRCELRPRADHDYEFHFVRNSTRTGRIRWSWASNTHWPPVPRPPVPTLPPTTTTTTPRVIYPPPTRPMRTGGCRMVSNQQGPLRTEDCYCTRASLFDLEIVPEAVHTLKFSNSVITTLYNEAFVKFGRYLRVLEFRECSIQKIEPRAFHGLWSLETLVIRGNYLDLVESTWFDRLGQLRTLDLARNRITRIENGVFDNVPHLRRLDVSDNLMNCIGTEHIESLQNLRELEVTGNPWTCLCATKLLQILRHKGVTCNCNPDSLIEGKEGGWGCHDTFTVHQPTSVYFGSPPWPRPPEQPPAMTHPTSSPQLRPETTSIPAPTQPPGPPSGSCHTSHETIEGGPWYNCAGGDINVLLHIPSYVTKIEIRDSYVPNLPAMIFSRFENLTDLAMINCTLIDVDQRAFAGLGNLQRLTLRHNRFTTVRSGWFRETSRISSIDLSDNDLSEIEVGSFVGLNYLEYLNFEGNAFRCIYTSSLVGIPRLATVEFGRNNRKISWRCWEELEEYLVVRGIAYTNQNCPHNGKELVKNLLKDGNAQAQKSGSTSLGFEMVFVLLVAIVGYYV